MAAVHAAVATRHHSGARRSRRCKLVGCRGRSGNRHALCRDLPAADPRHHQPAEARQIVLRSDRENQISAGAARLAALQPPFGSIMAIDAWMPRTRWRIRVGNSEAMGAIRQLGIHERLGRPARSWVLVTKTVMVVFQMGYYSPPRYLRNSTLRARSQQSRSAFVGLRQIERRDAGGDRAAGQRHRRAGHLSWLMASNISCSRSAAVR